MFRTKIQTWSFIVVIIIPNKNKSKTKKNTSVSFYKIGWEIFFLVYLCAIFVVSSEKNILKKLCIKFYFVLKRRLFFPFWGICVGGCGRKPAECFVLAGVRILTPLFHHPPSKRCRALSSVWGSAASQAWNQVALALRSPWWHWNDQVKATGIWFFPLVKGGSFGGLLKIDQRQFFTAPRTPLLCLVVTQQQIVFLSFCKWSFWKKCFRNRTFTVNLDIKNSFV